MGPHIGIAGGGSRGWRQPESAMRKPPVWRRGCAALGALVLAGCSPAEAPPPQAGAPQVQPAGAEVQALVVPDLMALLVDPAAGVMLAAAERPAAADGETRSDEAWQAVADAGEQLARTAGTLAQPAIAEQRTDWLGWTAALRAGADAGAAAAARHDAPGLSTAGRQISTACLACHERYAPEVAAAAAQPQAP
jgi:hypothetical protein